MPGITGRRTPQDNPVYTVHPRSNPRKLRGGGGAPPTGSTAGCALSPTPPQGGSDLAACTRLLVQHCGKVSTMFPVYGVKDVTGLHPGPEALAGAEALAGTVCGRDARAPRANHSPLEGESQKPSRQAKADAVGGTSQAPRLRQGRRRQPAACRCRRRSRVAAVSTFPVCSSITTP